MDGKAELPGSYIAKRLIAAYVIYVPLWAGSLVLGANLIAAALLFHRQGIYMAIVSVPVLLSLAAVPFTGLMTFREAEAGVTFNRFSRHVFQQVLGLVSIMIMTLIWYIAFNPVLFHLGDL